jgi:hypothetical protein
MFGDLKSPNGLLFIAKQQILSRTAVRTQTSGILNEGIYNPLGTLAQAGIVNIGGHLNKQGNILDETGAYSNNDNLYGVKIKPTQPSDENRLVTLYTNITQNLTTTNFGFVKGVSINPDARIAGNSVPVLMSYSGGPGSTLGVGITNIRYSPTSQTFVSKNPKTNTYNNSSINSNVWLLSSRNINKQVNAVAAIDGNDADGTVVGSVASPKVGVDFRKKIRDSLENNLIGPPSPFGISGAQSGQLAYSLDYTSNNIENRVNLGDPGQRQNNNYSNYVKGVTRSGKSIYSTVAPNSLGSSTVNGNQIKGTNTFAQLGLDKITSLPVYRSENADTTGVTNDLVKFRIAVVDNLNPSFKTFMHFRAFLGPMSDQYNATWNPVQYLGRGESFYNYNGFTRQISLSWIVAAQSKQELIPMYKKLNFLASSLTPDYSGILGYMKGNMIQLTVGGYLYEQPGIMTSLNYELAEDTPWEIGVGIDYNSEGGTIQGDSSVKELPHIIRVSTTFIPIQTFRPEVQPSGDWNGEKRYIALADGNGSENNNYKEDKPNSNQVIQNAISLGINTAGQ